MKAIGSIIISLMVLSVSGSVLYGERNVSASTSQIVEGRYNESDVITAGVLRTLPVPKSNQNYAIYQSIGKVTNIVLGQFKAGENQIVLLSDIDSDGKVDKGFIYSTYDKKTIKINGLSKVYTEEKFKKMKLEILNGESSDMNPNPDGANYLKKLIQNKSPLIRKVKFKNGYKVYINDPDDESKHRAMYYYSNNQRSTGGVDLAFQVLYHNVGSQMISPIISYNVYCNDSDDAVAAEYVDELSKMTKTMFGE